MVESAPTTRRNLRHVRQLGLLALTALVMVAAFTTAQDDDPPERVSDQDRHRPTFMPDRIILTIAGDPATTQAVTWRTDPNVRTAQAQIAVAGRNSQFTSGAKTLPAQTQSLQTNLGDSAYHSVTFTDLEPNTLYAYRVGDSVNWSEWFQFRTASTEAEPFTFIYFGDAQNEVRAHWSRVIREAYRVASEARFFLHAGDLINMANADAEWGDWHSAGGWLNGTLQSVATPGNHEYSSAGGQRGVSRHWRPQFTFPENGPEGLEETVYYFDYQGVRFISLNSNEDQEEQADWLRGVLQDNPHRWTILTFHHPIFSPARGRDNASLRKLWKPIFDEFDVDLVLQGHDHTYGRSGLIHGENVSTGTQLRDTDNGTVYAVSVSGPKMYTLGDGDWMQKSAVDTQLFQVIRLDGDVLRYEAYTASGELFDVFEMHKDGDRKRMVEFPESTPDTED